MNPIFIEEADLDCNDECKSPLRKRERVEDEPTPPSSAKKITPDPILQSPKTQQLDGGSFMSHLKKYAHPMSIKEGRLVDKNNTDLELPRAFRLHRNNIELQQLRETRMTGTMVRMRLNKQQLRYVWQSQYGFQCSAICMCCRVTPINWDSVSANASHIVSDAQLGNPDRPWNFLFLCGDCNQKGTAKAKNAFDQIADVRPDRVFMYAHVLMKMYFENEVIDYTFKGREDFVRQIYGDASKDHHGGIESTKIFELLRQLDETHPLPIEERNPFLKAISPLHPHLNKTSTLTTEVVDK
jgi:hypothetical protein